MSTMRRANCWRAAEAPISPRLLRRRKLEFESSMPQFENLGDLTEGDCDPDKIAIIDLGGENPPREFSYRRLDEIARAVARAVWGRGFVRGDRVAILSANRAEYIATLFGIMRAGLIAVPVNFKFPRATIDFIITDSGAKLVFCDPERCPDAPPHLPLAEFGGRNGNAFDEFFHFGPFRAVPPGPREPAM